MSLIRSEHAHDQAVEASKDAVTAAEQALEEARARLEKRERAQYHEEQIWSDTIRRNGTWITLGLMGVNIALLVVNLVAVEPWRRKRLVGEIKGLLKDEMGTRGDINTHETLTTNESNKVSGEPMSGENVDGDNAEGENVEVSAYQSGVVLEEPTAITDNAFQPLNSEWIASYFRNPFGEQIITISKTDLTGLVLQSAATGSILIWAIFYILRPR
jgi:sensitive to high expression protein 9